MNQATQLAGKWVTDPSDKEALDQYGSTTMVFTESGDLRYIIHSEGKDQVMLLTYRIDKGTLITNQSSAPGEERTEFFFTPDGKLVLDYGGSKSHYVRSS